LGVTAVESALDRLPCGYVAFADDGTILSVNDKLLELLGRERAEVAGTRLDNILAPGGAAFYSTHFFPMLKMHGAADEIYLVLQTKSGGIVPVLAYGVRGDVNECVFISVARREQYQNEIATARERVIGVLGHDLRVPITAVALGAETLLRQETLSPQGQQTALSILSSARRAARMTAELLDFAQARFTAGIPVQRQPINLRAVAEKVMAELRTIHPDVPLELRAAGDCRGSWDADRAAQVVANLVDNAIEHRCAGAPVIVLLEGCEDAVVLEVTNAAEPMDASAAHDLFSPFSRRRGSSGIGLGLFIVREVMRAHGGSVAASATAGEFRVRAVWPRSG
jgi:signal transduction histidine kinase